VTRKIKTILIISVVTIIPLSYYAAYSYAIELNNKAMKVAIEKDWNNKENLQNALNDINISIKIYPWNTVFYINKLMLQFRLNDINGALLTNQNIIDLNPKPLYIVQRGLIYELLDDSINANINYKKGIDKYEYNFNTETDNNIQNKLEYIELLVITGNKNKANIVSDKLKSKNPNNYFIQNYKLKSKKEVLNLLTNNTTFKQLKSPNKRITK